MEDVARLAGVSRALVSLVIREPKVSERRADVLAAASSGYRPNLLARNLASRRTMTIGVLLNDLHNPFFAESRRPRGGRPTDTASCSVLAGAGPPTEPRRSRRSSSAARRHHPREPPHPGRAGSRPPPRRCRWLSSGAASRAGVRHRQQRRAGGRRLAVEHLVGLGHEQIVHIDGGRGAGVRRGGRATAGPCAATVSPGRRWSTATSPSSPGVAGEPLGDGDLPTAIFAANDLDAVGALDALEEPGCGCPTTCR